MGIILYIVFGAIAGYIASLIVKTRTGLLWDIVIGIIGAIIGGWIMGTFGHAGVTGFNIYSLLVAILGAVVLLFIVKMLTRGTSNI